MKTKIYAFVAVELERPNNAGIRYVVGSVTKSILKSDKNKNKRVRVLLIDHTIRYPRRKQIYTVAPIS